MDTPAFWDNLDRYGTRPCLIEHGTVHSYEAIERVVRGIAGQLRVGEKSLAILSAKPEIQTIVTYLALLRAGYAICLADATTAQGEIRSLVAAYQPYLVIGFAPDLALEGYRIQALEPDRSLLVRSAAGPEVSAGLTLLMPTSGSTSVSKHVRLSRANILSAAEQVRDAVHVSERDRAVLQLPLAHIYGLTVLHSHVLCGATLVLPSAPILSSRFWNDLRTNRVTTLPGVSFTYEVMKQLGIRAAEYPDLRKLTHASDPIARSTAEWLTEAFASAERRIYFMYGQTEACGRIAVLPPSLASTKLGAVGRAVGGGVLSIAADGEILFKGPNVSLGYARSASDLAAEDELRGELATGDMGHLDEEGLLHVVGRKRRFCKIYGKRINLDEVQLFFNDVAPVAAVSDDSQINIVFEQAPPLHAQRQVELLAERYCIPRSSIRISRIERFPRSTTGKILYTALQNRKEWP